MPYRRFFYDSIGERLSRPASIFMMVLHVLIILGSAMTTGLSGLTLGLLVAWAIVTVPAFTATINRSPEMRVSDDDLSIRYFFSWLRIPWNEVLGLTLGESQLTGKFCLVRFKRLPFLLRLYQAKPTSYTSGPEPKFPFLFIDETITDYEDLVAIIKAKIEEPRAKLYL